MKKNKSASSNKIATPFLEQYEEKLKQIYKRLTVINCTENSLIQIELLYYEVTSLLTGDTGIVETSILLEQIRSLHVNEYALVLNKQVTIRNRVIAIKRFKNSFRQVIYQAINSRPH